MAECWATGMCFTCEKMTLDLTDEEAVALARYLRQKLDYERFPLATRLDPLKAILYPCPPMTLAAAAAQRAANSRTPHRQRVGRARSPQLQRPVKPP